MSIYPELPVRIAEHLSDEAIATLIESLYAFAEALENRYYAELQRHYRNNRNDLRSNKPELPDQFPRRSNHSTGVKTAYDPILIAPAFNAEKPRFFTTVNTRSMLFPPCRHRR